MRQSKKLEKSFWVWHLNSPPVRKIYETSTFKIAPSSPQPRHHRHHHHREYLATKITEKDNVDDSYKDEQYEGLIYWGPQLGNFGQQVLAFVSFIKSLLAKNLSHCQHHYHQRHLRQPYLTSVKTKHLMLFVHGLNQKEWDQSIVWKTWKLQADMAVLFFQVGCANSISINA